MTDANGDVVRRRRRRLSRWTWPALALWSSCAASFFVAPWLNHRAFKITVLPGELWISWTTHATNPCRRLVFPNGSITPMFVQGSDGLTGFGWGLNRHLPPLWRRPFWLPRVYPIIPEMLGFHRGEWMIGVPLWIPSAVATGIAIARRRRRNQIGRCAVCGYDLSGHASGAACPECGPKA